MSYSNLEKKLTSSEVVILDGGIGAELEKLGASIDKDLWSGRCSIDNPEIVREVHQNFVNSGADVITTNTYASTPISMKEYGYGSYIEDWNNASVKIARQVADSSDQEIAVAGSVSTCGSWDRMEPEYLKPGFNQQVSILSDAGVDLIILEAMTSSTRTIETILESSNKSNLPVWLSISCALDREQNKLMLGYQESLYHSEAFFYDDFEIALKKFTSMHNGPILIAHTDFKITNQAVKEIRNNYKGIIGAYPNNGFFEKPNWNTTEDILPKNYCKEAKIWIESGAQIIGGCCGIGPSHIKALTDLS
jgi:homocysteine S-methyltransferase